MFAIPVLMTIVLLGLLVGNVQCRGHSSGGLFSTFFSQLPVPPSVPHHHHDASASAAASTGTGTGTRAGSETSDASSSNGPQPQMLADPPSPSTVTTDSPIHDVAIIGSGPAGCTAAIYTGRALLKPLVIAGYMAGGQLMLTSDVENFPGYPNSITGPGLMDDLTQQATKFGAEICNIDCSRVDLSRRPFKLHLANGTTLESRTLIISTGARALWLDADREDEFKGKGISTCATCDGYLFRNKPVVVVGGGDSAMEEANFLTRFASSVTLIHRRDTFRASKVMLKRVTENPKIKVLTNKVVQRWDGQDGILSGAVLRDMVTGEQDEMKCDGAFIAVGHVPNTKFLGGQVELDESGYVKLKSNSMTSVPGVFACGDVADHRYKQAITAAGSGCQAAIDAERWLEEQKTHGDK